MEIDWNKVPKEQIEAAIKLASPVLELLEFNCRVLKGEEPSSTIDGQNYFEATSRYMDSMGPFLKPSMKEFIRVDHAEMIQRMMDELVDQYRAADPGTRGVSLWLSLSTLLEMVVAACATPEALDRFAGILERTVSAIEIQRRQVAIASFLSAFGIDLNVLRKGPHSPPTT